jgi:predicted glycosyltransferase
VKDRPTVLLYCQHSLGLGHLTRSWALAEHLSRGFRVVLVSGGASPIGVSPPDGIETVALPPLVQEADGQLVGCDAAASVDEIREDRKRQLTTLYRQLRPDVVLIELFPFGRRKFQDEILALLEETRREPRPVVASSVRDLLVNRADRQQQYDERARQMLDTWFDLVLVHADPTFACLDDTFRPLRRLTTPVHHTGFVVAERDGTEEQPPRSGILVSGGGGRFAERLYDMAIDAHVRLGSTAAPMTIVAGPLCPEDVCAKLRAAAAARTGIRIERAVQDLCGEMRRAAVSVSQCGYNTALDIVRAGVPAVVVPFDDNGDSEQTVRADRLAALNAVRVVRSAAGADVLAAAIAAATGSSPAAQAFDLCGGQRSLAILTDAVQQCALVAGCAR